MWCTVPAPGTPRVGLLEEDASTARLAACLPVVRCELGEAEGVAQECLAGGRVGDERADGLEALERVLGWNLERARDQRLIVGLDDGELVAHSLRVGEPQPPGLTRHLDALAREALAPEVERGLGADAVDDRGDHAGTGASGARSGVLEERDVGAGGAELVRVEEVVDGGVVLVDRLLDEPQTEHARVEVDVATGVAGDQGDVVDAVDCAHGRRLILPGFLVSLRRQSPRTNMTSSMTHHDQSSPGSTERSTRNEDP